MRLLSSHEKKRTIKLFWMPNCLYLDALEPELFTTAPAIAIPKAIGNAGLWLLQIRNFLH
ncbi:hypothetical protein TSUD_240770 [Trifolium subterraneum]|uniref:Uncharacterized protein n=1 Tax=Trifolium subterraneum TaxID=3900 RepID=A0A2Z6PLF8_TRISU|nr:hypothetical protein TSUD_240770 [Trifolium subterraneum]